MRRSDSPAGDDWERFRRVPPAFEPVWPNSSLPDECQAPVRAFAALNEYEPLTFSILPLRDLPALDLEIGDLTTADGRVIPRSHLDLRFVRYMVVRPNYLTTGVYYEAPDVLMPWTPQQLRAGLNLTVWLTVRTGPAIRRGSTVARSARSAAARYCTTSHCPPVSSPAPPSRTDLTYGQYYHHPYRQMSAARPVLAPLVGNQGGTGACRYGGTRQQRPGPGPRWPPCR